MLNIPECFGDTVEYMWRQNGQTAPFGVTDGLVADQLDACLTGSAGYFLGGGVINRIGPACPVGDKRW